MGPQIAVDVGCTTVVGATADGDGEPRLLEFEGEDGVVGAMTASLLLRPDGSARVGGEADRALDADPHRGVRGPLAHLESGSAVLELGSGPVPVVALVGELLARPLRVLARGLPAAPPDRAVLAIPSAWPPEGRRGRALRAAAALAGLPPVVLVPAAVAVAELACEGQTQTLLVCDVGGRATQLSLVDVAPGVHRLLATTELAVGTDLFDETLYLEILRRLEDHDPAAAQRLEQQHLLNPAVDAASPDATAWVACQAELARAVRRCREELAQAPAWELEIGLPVLLRLEVQRERLAGLLENELGLVAAAARAQVDQLRAATATATGSPQPGPARAVLAGGGAQAPGLRAALAAELDLPVSVLDDPVTAVARGALLVASRSASLPAAGRGTAPRDPRRPAPLRRAQRDVLDHVAAAVVSADEIVAVVRHDSHQRVVRADASGRVGAAHGIGGSDVIALAATPSAVVAASAVEGLIFDRDLRPLATLARPLLAAADGMAAWIACAGDEQAPILRLTTLAISGRAAHAVAEERLGLALAPASGRGGLRQPARGPRPAPPRAHWDAADGRLLFAIRARGRGSRPAQLLGEAGAAGLGAVDTKVDGPPWVVARTAAGGSAAVLTGGAGSSARLALGTDEVATWPAGVSVRLAGVGDAGAPWVVAARHARWEALRLAGTELVPVRAGGGAVEFARGTEGGLWLVCESGGERRLVCVTPAGELERLAAVSAPLEPLGYAGGELLALVGARDATRRLVALG